MKKPDETPQLPLPDGTVEEIYTANEDGTSRLTGRSVRWGLWSAHIDFEKRHTVRLCYKGRSRMESKGEVAFQRAAELAEHFHSKNHDPDAVPA